MTNLADIQEDDAMAGDDLQMMPEVYTHRRFLIQRLDAFDKAVKELDELLGIGVTSLDEIIVEVRARIEMQRGHAVALDEFRAPFQQAATEAWLCASGYTHRVGEFCGGHES